MTYTYTLSTVTIIWLTALVVWDLFWKAWAIWRAAHHDQPVWFGFLLVLNTAGVLPILYLLFHRAESTHSHPAVVGGHA